MAPFYTKFPELAFEETRSALVRGDEELPDGEYGFLELYCDEAHCDCRRVMINVVAAGRGPRVWATINYGWESLEFYERWLRSSTDAAGCRGPSLDPLNPQTQYSPALLSLFEFLLQDQEYAERLKRHYYLFKGAIAEAHRPKRRLKRKRKPARRR